MKDEFVTSDLLTKRGSFREWLQTVSSKAGAIDIAVGYLSPEGLSTLLGVIQPYLARIDRVRVLAGELQPAQDPEKVKGLRSLRLELRDKVEIRKRPRREGIFHPKVYLVRVSDGLRACIGSSNLTSSALQHNIEADLALEMREGQEFLRTFEDWWSDGIDVEPEEWPLFPTLEALINQSMRDGALIRVQTFLERATVRLRANELNESFHGKLLTLRETVSGNFPVVRPAAIRDLNNTVGKLRQKIRQISLKSPWEARFVPSRAQSRLLDLLGSEEDSLRRAVQAAQENVIPKDEFEKQLQIDAEKAAKILKAADRPEVIEQLIEKALRDYQSFVESCPRPLDAWVEVLPAPLLESTDLKSPSGLQRRMAATVELQWRNWLITVAGAPRRSLLKYQDLKRSQDLCVVPDPKLRRVAFESRQTSMFDPDESPAAAGELELQLKEIGQWWREPFPVVLKRLSELLEIEQ